MKIYKLEINCLRGIKHLVLEFKGKNAVIYGDNGTGKSGVIDAIDFLLQGNISRIVGDGMGELSLTTHGKHVTEDLNDAWVSAEIKLPLYPEKFTVTRRLKRPKDIECDDKYKDGFLQIASRAKMKAHFLSRREILKYINSTDGNRAKSIESLLNLDTLAKSRTLLLKLQKEHETSLNREKENYKAIVSTINEKLQVGSMDDWLDAINDLRLKFQALPLYSYEEENLLKGVHFSSQEKIISRKTAELDEVASILNMFTDSKGLLPLLEELLLNFKQLSELGEIQSCFKRLELYKAGIPTIETDVCPLCGQPINASDLHSSLTQKIENLSTVDKLKKEKESLLGLIQAKTISILAKCGQLKKSENPEILYEIEKLENFKTLLTGEVQAGAVNSFLQTFQLVHFEEYKVQLGKEIAHLSLNSLQASYNVLFEIDNLLTELFKKKKGIQQEERIYDRITILSSTYATSQESWLNNLYKSIETDFSSYYRQMHHDDESTFSGILKKSGASLSMRVDFFDGEKYPPNAVHSEGHQDSMGICLFFALSKKIANDNLGLILLDDVVMSIDIDHRISFCNLLKKEFPDKQFVITTHDYIWRKELEQQQIVTSENVFYFKAWDITKGPLLAKSNDIWERIFDDLSSGSKNEAAYLLRYYLEEFSADICARYHLLVPYSSTARWSLEEKFSPTHSFFKASLKAARESLVSYSRDTSSIDELIKKYEDCYKALNTERWLMNPSTHFTDWAQSVSIVELQSLAKATKEYCECLICEKCKRLFTFTEVINGKPKQIACDCGEYMYSCIKKTN